MTGRRPVGDPGLTRPCSFDTIKGKRDTPNPPKRRSFGAFGLVVIDLRQQACFLRTQNHPKSHPFWSKSFPGAGIPPAEAKTQGILIVFLSILTKVGRIPSRENRGSDYPSYLRGNECGLQVWRGHICSFIGGTRQISDPLMLPDCADRSRFVQVFPGRCGIISILWRNAAKRFAGY